MKNIKLIIAALLITAGISAQSTYTPYVPKTVFHYSSGWTTLSLSISATNQDSAYYANTGHVGTIGDSVGDSTFFYLQFNNPGQGALLSMGVFPDVKSDTLCDSVIIYQLQTSWSVVARQKVYNTTGAQFSFNLIPTFRSGSALPELFKVLTKYKKKAGKGSATLRIRPSFVIGQ